MCNPWFVLHSSFADTIFDSVRRLHHVTKIQQFQMRDKGTDLFAAMKNGGVHFNQTSTGTLSSPIKRRMNMWKTQLIILPDRIIALPTY